MIQLRDEIINFFELNVQQLCEDLKRFNNNLIKFPNEEVLDKILCQIFYRDLDQLNKRVANNVTEDLL